MAALLGDSSDKLLTQQQIADRLGISRLQVNRWVGRFVTTGWPDCTTRPDAAASRGWPKGRPSKCWSAR